MPLNQMQAELDFKDLLDLVKKDIKLDINCHGIATVQEFDSVKLVVKATMNYSQTYYQQNLDGSTAPIQKDYPILVDCPVIILGGGNCSLTFPIQKGDECLILFNDRDIDNWAKGARSGPVASNRLHSFSDGIALVGFIKPSVYDAVRTVLRNGDTYIGVSSTKVKIANGTTTLNTLLGQLINAIKAITTLNSDLTTGAVSAASQANLTSIATQIGGLLE